MRLPAGARGGGLVAGRAEDDAEAVAPTEDGGTDGGAAPRGDGDRHEVVAVGADRPVGPNANHAAVPTSTTTMAAAAKAYLRLIRTPGLLVWSGLVDLQIPQ